MDKYFNFIIIIINILIIKMSLYFIRKIESNSEVFQITPLSLLFYKEFFGYSIIGSSLIFMGFGKSYYAYYYISNHTTQFYVWVSVLYGTIVFFFSIYIIEKYFKKNVFRIVLKKVNSLCKIKNEKVFYFIVIIFTLSSFLYFLYYCYKVKYIPLISIIKLNSQELSLLRYNDKFLENGSSIIKNLLLITLPPICSYSSYLGYKQINKKRWKNLFKITIVNALLCLTFRFEKSYLIYYFLGFIFLPIVNNKNINSKKIFNKKILYLVLIIVLAMLYVLYVNGKELLSITNIYRPLDRIIYSQILGLFRHYEIFPENIDFLKFQYFPTIIAKLFSNIEIRSARIVMMASSSSSTAGNLNTFFMGEAYANGGIIAIIIAPILIAVMLYLQYFLFNLLDDNIITRSCIIFLFLNNISITGGFLDFFYNPNYIILFIICLILNLFTKSYRKK